MVEGQLSDSLSEDLFDMLPYQESVVNQLLNDGILLHYAFSLEQRRFWAVFTASSQIEVMEILEAFPLIGSMDVNICLLHQYNYNHSVSHFSLN